MVFQVLHQPGVTVCQQSVDVRVLLKPLLQVREGRFGNLVRVAGQYLPARFLGQGVLHPRHDLLDDGWVGVDGRALRGQVDTAEDPVRSFAVDDLPGTCLQDRQDAGCLCNVDQLDEQIVPVRDVAVPGQCDEPLFGSSPCL